MSAQGDHHYNLGLAFEDVARRHGTRTALHLSDGRTVTFAALNALANRTAHWLLSRGVASGDVVAIFHDKSPEAYALMLACLRTGAIYVNLDQNSPTARLQKIIGTCLPRCIIQDCIPTHGSVDAPGVATIDLHAPDVTAAIAACPATLPPACAAVTGAHPAYIMFTSGSTGFPKGATMSHRNVLNFIAWAKDEYRITPDDRFTNVNPMYFDNSVFDLYASLFNGATLIPFPYGIVKDPFSTIALVRATKPTVWFSVPSLLAYLITTKAIDREAFASLRIVTFGGEGFPKPTLKKLWDMYAGRLRFVNVYGPTECTCICSAYDITADDLEDLSGLAPLGQLAPNFDHVVLDADADGIGELALRGPQVGLGYYNDPERTAASFIQHPGHNRYPDRLYRTGDLVATDAQGRLHFKGRKDNQIKHMGYRIELEEIEAAFAALPGVHETGVVYKRAADGSGRICAFVAATPGTEYALMDAVKRLLPPYMVPRSLTIMDVLPKNANGKIDRRALLERIPS